jgi:hypothetical protein
MAKLRTIAVFLCLLMTLQMLPIAQIGSMLSSNQWTEELPHHTESGKNELPATPQFLPPYDNEVLSHIAAVKAMLRIHAAAEIPSNHSTDIVCPPPDLHC